MTHLVSSQDEVEATKQEKWRFYFTAVSRVAFFISYLGTMSYVTLAGIGATNFFIHIGFDKSLIVWMGFLLTLAFYFTRGVFAKVKEANQSIFGEIVEFHRKELELTLIADVSALLGTTIGAIFSIWCFVQLLEFLSGEQLSMLIIPLHLWCIATVAGGVFTASTARKIRERL